MAITFVDVSSYLVFNYGDLLRNEKPIKFFFRDDNLAAYITTSSEPVGENE